MRRIIICFFVSFFIFSFLNIKIYAIDCDYPEAGLTVTYDANSNVTMDYDKFSSSDYYYNLVGLVKWGQTKYNSSEIEINQDTWKKYKGESCPTNIILCEYSNWSFKPLGSIKGMGLTLADYWKISGCKSGAIDDDTCKSISDEAYAIFTIDEKKLYVLDYESYEKSGLEKYKNGMMSNDLKDGFDKGYNACTDDGKNQGFGWIIWGGVCGTIRGVMESQVQLSLGDGLDAAYYRRSVCSKVKYEGPYPAFDINCALFNQNRLSYESAVGNYKNCDDDRHCKTTAIKDMNRIEDQLKAYCTSVLRNYDFNEFQEDCINNCLTIKHDLNELRKGTDLYESYENVGDSCSISLSIISMVYNVLKWVKYILPALVIILTMLDFIKAIAAQNDDDMKKAQGKFVKRLIVAALLFLLPLIINFVLQTFGFYDSSCDITDLFKK